ncbi:MAG TPA: PIN domain-containing protein [Tepidisphaeraceae bacterium]|jgi:predicted nucleic acid-binding protein
MKVLFDLNVVLDLLLAREPWAFDARAAVELVSQRRIDGCVSAASLPTLFYIARKSVGATEAFECVTQCAAVLDIVPVDELTIRLALAARRRDFEDDLQVAAAVEAGCSHVVTRDADRFPNDQLPTITPRELLEITLP